jgi:hypothetical protein
VAIIVPCPEMTKSDRGLERRATGAASLITVRTLGLDVPPMVTGGPCTGATRGRPPTRADGPTGLFSLRSAELIQGFLMQDLNLSQVSLRFFNVMSYGVQLFPDCNLASMIQRGLKALDAKCSTSGKGISLLYFVAG